MTGGNLLGNVFKLAPDGSETSLYAFKGGNDGAEPWGSLLADSSGNLYGVTQGGGGTACHGVGCGTVFKLAADGSETVLYAFQGGNDGAGPNGNLISDAQGNLYGTTEAGNGTGCNSSGCGSVFEIAPNGTETVLHAFSAGSDGGNPYGGVIADSAGNLYGVTFEGGGTTGCGEGCGTVYKLAPGGSETVLYAFQGGQDGERPNGSLVADSAGNLYGATIFGGAYGRGTIFKVAPNGSETVLYSFKIPGGSSGNLLLDASGNLYGTTTDGGNCSTKHGCGTVFKLAPNGQETPLHDFRITSNGAYPNAGLIADGNGNLYGTTSFGGQGNFGGYGVVFTLKE